MKWLCIKRYVEEKKVERKEKVGEPGIPFIRFGGV
jgi:hypothetical protein